MTNKKAHSLVGKLIKVKIPGDDFVVAKNRTIRIWLPSDYDEHRTKPYEVLYMFDGQNLFDKYSSAFNMEWEIDETIENAIKKGKRSKVVVGIDCSKKREDEFTPAFFDKYKNIKVKALDSVMTCRGELTVNYLMDKVIPHVESHFNVSSENRGIGGSSLGGLMATLVSFMHPEEFSYCLAFSPAYFLYNLVAGEDLSSQIADVLSDSQHLNKFKFIITSGGRGFEKQFTKPNEDFYEMLIKRGWDEDKVIKCINKSYSHNERQWAHFFKKIYSKIA